MSRPTDYSIRTTDAADIVNRWHLVRSLRYVLETLNNMTVQTYETADINSTRYSPTPLLYCQVLYFSTVKTNCVKYHEDDSRDVTVAIEQLYSV